MVRIQIASGILTCPEGHNQYLHLLRKLRIVDAEYELPIAWSVTNASIADITAGKELVKEMKKNQSWAIENAEYLMADKGYDAGDLIRLLRNDAYQIHPIIDKRSCWRDSQSRLLFEGRNASYKEDGSVYCHEDNGKSHLMVNGGYDEKRKALKKLCPAKAKGIQCQHSETCNVKSGLRVKLSTDDRIFTSIDRTSYKWKRLYKMRTSVERVNSRLDRSFGFEIHTIRGLAKMKTNSTRVANC